MTDKTEVPNALETPYSGAEPLVADADADPYRAAAQTLLREPVAPNLSLPILEPGQLTPILDLMSLKPRDPGEAWQTRLETRGHYRDAERSVRTLMALCHGSSFTAGWWGNPKMPDALHTEDHHVPVKLMLIVSEISEAMEGHRKGLMDDKLPHRPMIEVELADAMIRILDLAGALGLDLGGALVEKMRFNAQRADHKPENRAAAGGKAY